MSVEEVKRFVLAVMARDFTLVPTPSGKGDRVHLEVWEHRRTGLPLGLEMDHSTLVNLWLVRRDVPLDLPLSIGRTDKEPDGDGWTDEDGSGANHNLKNYPQFAGKPITRLALTNVRDAEDVLSRPTRGEISSRSGRSTDGFLLKINGLLHAPHGICRPASAADWEGGTITMPFEGGKVSCRYDMSTGPDVAPGDAVYIWTHEDKAFGHGRGLTARATAGTAAIGNGFLQVELRDVRLLPNPFGFKTLGAAHDGGRLLAAMDDHRHLRCWYMAEEDRSDIDKLIETYGSAMAAAKAAAEAAYLTPLERAINEHANEIERAEEERKTAVVKARPGQQTFREEAMRRHRGRCVVTGSSVKEVLDAAHVIPHTGVAEFEVPENSLLLRRDIHALFDACLIAIHPKSGEIVCAPSLARSSYKSLVGRVVDHKLAPKALDYQYQRFRSEIRERDGSQVDPSFR